MEQLLSGRTALITGGGTGIGRGIAIELAKAGARIAITYRTHAPDDQLAQQIRDLCGVDLIAVALDATSEAEVGTALGTVRQELGTLDVLVNNIGGLIKRSTIADMDYALWRQVISVNLDSMFLVTHHALPLISSGRGRIINVASLAGRNGGHAGATAYASSKAAVFGFTRGLAKELAPSGITVNALAPGFIVDTPFHETFTAADSKEATIATIPMQRAGTPEDVAGAAVWLASDLSRFVTGTVVDINGGQYFG
jgi:3-oxoacyl-[acyl-carrier protein] reductase